MIRYWNLKVLLFGIMSLCMSCIGAFSNPYTSFEINYQQGLSNSAVLSICQDSQGLMWFGTYDGLNCYDGKHIEVYRTDFSRGKPWTTTLFPICRWRAKRDFGCKAFPVSTCFPVIR